MIRKLHFAWIVLALLSLSACASLGVPPADTFNKQVIQANGLVEVTANMVPVAYQAGKLSQDEARNTLRRLRDTATGIDAAVILRPSNLPQAEARLAAAIVALQAIKVGLEEKSK